MATTSKKVHKHFQLNAGKIKRAQKLFSAKTETEAIERALDYAISEHEKNRLIIQAHDRFFNSDFRRLAEFHPFRWEAIAL